MDKEEPRLAIKGFWMKGRGAKLIHQELTSTLGNDAYGPFEIKVWLQRSKSGDLSCNSLLRAGP
jgi:hypothetical protein